MSHRRLRGKTTPQHLQPQHPLPEALQLDDEGSAKDKRQVYLVTLPHPRQPRSADGINLGAPGSLSKEDILQRFLDSCARPLYTDPNSVANG